MLPPPRYTAWRQQHFFAELTDILFYTYSPLSLGVFTTILYFPLSVRTTEETSLTSNSIAEPNFL